MEEIWKPIKGYEGYYEISNLGRVKSVKRIITQRNSISKCIKESYIKISTSKLNYKFVFLSKNSKRHIHYIHRLIAEAFIPNKDNKPCVDHIDTNPSNNDISNLRWVTEKENSSNTLTLKHLREKVYIDEVQDKILKTRKLKNTLNSPKTVYQYTKEGVFVHKYFSISEAERETGVDHIDEVLDDTSLSAGGFLWLSTPKDNIRYTRRRKSKIKPIQLLDKEGNIISEWKTITEAAKALKISSTKISRILKYEISKDYNFKYKQGV